MSDRKIEHLAPELQELCRQFIKNCDDVGITIGISCTYRSNEDQDKAYAQGRTVEGKIITNAKAGQSAHNCVDDCGNPASKAFDFFIINDNGSADWNVNNESWQQAIEIGEKLGLKSGSHFKNCDYAHLELPDFLAS